MENKSRHNNRRRNYFIKKKFQAAFIIKFCILVIIGSALSGGIIYLASRSTVTTTFENSRLTIKSTADYILPAVLLASLVVIVVVGLATIIVTLFTSHKIAGPLYRLEKDIEELIAGNLKKKFNLRNADQLKPLAEGFNIMAESLRRDMEKIKHGIYEIESAHDAAQLKKKLEDIKSTLKKFET